MSDTAIGEHALLSDCRSAALVDSAGSVEWLCFPRFDSPAVFARLLDDDAGHWSLRPAGPAVVTRRYVPGTLVLETTCTTATGTLVLRDALAMGEGVTGHDLGARSPHLLVREARCTAGSLELEIDCRPRPEHGLVHPVLTAVDGGATARGGAEQLVLTSPVPLALGHGTATGTAVLHAGERLLFALHRSTLEQHPARVWSAGELRDRLDGTERSWRSWAAQHQTYEGPWRELVHHSGRVLQALTYQPSGAIVAAPTTSLPEEVGGSRNWDYRYSWVRDASLTMEALWVAACPHEASGFFSFMTTAAATSVLRRAPLNIVFGVGGERDLSERPLGHLRGWRGSAPVRVGNGAWEQSQLDVYGELLGAAHRLREQLDDLDDDTRRFLAALADAAAERWREPDQGIWEVRGEPRHFVHSKVMCWVALDRAVDLADLLGAQHRVPAWRRARDEVAEAVLREGWSEEAGSFTQAFGCSELDASTLLLPVVGFLPADDRRILATLDAVQERLTSPRGLVYRYRGDDGVGGSGSGGDGGAGEGTFLLCTFWLAQALALSGQVERAREVFERAVACVNDVGLLAEEVDEATGELLGNFPQAFSHIGLVNAAHAIGEAERAAADGGRRPAGR